MIKKIRIDDKRRAKRLKQLTSLENPTSLLPELGVLRMLEEEAVNSGNPRAVVEIIRAIGNLAHSTEITKIRRGELLAKPAVLMLATKFAQLLTDKISGRFEGWEEAIQQVSEESRALIVNARNVKVDE